MGRLNANTILTRPGDLEVTVLMAGAEVPEWATELVGSHLLAEEVEASATEPPALSGAGSESTPEVPHGVPDGSWKVDDLRAYAKAHDVNLEGATSKADILKQLGV